MNTKDMVLTREYYFKQISNNLAKIYLPINLAWMATDTSFHNFGIDNAKAECLSGIGILKSISSNKEALFTPLVIGVYDYFAEMQQAVIQGKRDLEIRTSW
ncbi:hypothetical protein [Nostoc sp.]|uniref:hypothetical protein n=1 Tax=Nostoc sp. TaxID=1180 RepID=UPI002FF45396